MKTISNISISNNASIFALFAALFALCALIIARVINDTFAALKVAAKWLKAVYLWFITPKTYFASDGDGVTVSGLQIVGINLIAFIACILLAIKW